MPLGKHYGSFAKGFIDSLIAMMKLNDTIEYHKAHEAYWYSRGMATGKGAQAAGDQEAFNIGRGGAHPYQGGDSGGTGDSVSTGASLDANQREAYQAARSEGLSDNAARAFVANTTGEGLGVPGDKHLDPNGKQNAFGIVQWDDQRAAAIKQQFGKYPNEMSVGDQTKAAIWEMKTNPRFADSWKALNSNASPQDMVKTLVTNYEQPKNVDVAINQRLQHLGNLSTDLTPTAGTQIASAGGGNTRNNVGETLVANNAPSGDKPAAFIMHHTVIDGSPQDIVDFWKKQGKGYGAQYIMDRNGVVHDTAKEFGYNGTNEILDDKKHGLTNSNVVGMEIIAKNDKDVTPAQAKSAAAFVKTNYPTTPVYGHGQVNPDHKEATEGATAVAAVNADRGAPTKGPNAGKTSTQVAANVPSKAATPEEAETAAPDGGFRIPGQDPSPGPEDQEIAARQAHGQGTLPPAPLTHSLQPQDMPSSGVGASGLPPPPARPVTPTPQPATINAATDTSPYVQPSRPVTPTGTPLPASVVANPPLPPSRPSDEANKPAPAAQPVSSSAPPAGATPSAPTSAPAGYTMVERPNADPTNRGGGAPQMTALDLSHLWGPNPPLAQRAQAPTPAPAPAAPIKLPDNADYDAAASDDMFTASAKGGPITRRYAGGGAIPMKPTTAFYGGGSGVDPAPQTFSAGPQVYAPTAGFSTLENAMGTLIPQSGPLNIYGSPQNPADQASLAAWNKLTPDQQTWYTGAQAALQQGLSQPSAMQDMLYKSIGAPPSAQAAATPAPTAATPAPTIVNPPSVQNITTYPASTTTTDPTTGTVTGAPGLPNSVTAKSYDPNVDQQTGASFSNTSNSGGTNYSVGSDDLLQQNANGKISGNQNILSRKGGPIGFARGGIPTRPTIKFAAAGAVGGANPAYEAILSGTYAGPTSGGGWMGTPESQLAPNQQTWAQGQQNIWGTIDQATAARDFTGRVNGLNQLTMMPDAVWPTATPAAPTSVAQPPPSVSTITSPSADTTATDPTTGTVTGAPGLPNSITAKSYDPNVDQQTGAGFTNTSNTGGTNYSVGSDDTLQQNAQGQISGSRKGGPITRRVTRYDDGGEVSPSAAGMPPGLGSQQAAIPPIYYNPATYSAAGAPVGKGVSQPSAPTFNAGAVPTLPMTKGGAVAFADGGDVDDGAEEANNEFEMQRDAATDASSAQAAPQAGSLFTPADYQTPVAPQQQQGPPPGVDPMTPQIKDDQGNPSQGVTGAIAGGLHWLADHLGLSGSGQQGAIASDPQTQANRQGFATGQGTGSHAPMTQDQHQQIMKIVDPNNTLDDNMRNLAGMEAVRKLMLSQGRVTDADKMSASMMQYSVGLAQQYGDEAAKRYYDNDLPGAVKALNAAADAVPDGKKMSAQLAPDGKSVIVTGSDLNGRTEWQKDVAPSQILGAALGFRTGQLQWSMLESQAARYDPATAQIIRDRTAQRAQQNREDIIDKREADKQAAAQKGADAEGAVLTGMYQPKDGGAPALTPVGKPTPALPGPGGVTTTASAAPSSPAPTGPPNAPTAQPASPPPDADSNAAPLPGAGIHGIPPAPTPQPTNVAANLPAPGAQNVLGDTGPDVPNNPSQDPRFASLNAAQQGRVMQVYGQAVQARRAWEAQQYKQAHDDAQAERSRQSQEGIAARQERGIKAHEQGETQRAADRQTFETQKENSAREHDMTKPRDAKDVAATFSTVPNETGVASGKDPTTYMAEAMGYKKPDGTVDTDTLNKNFNSDEQNTITNAMVNGYSLSPRTTAPMVTKAILGSLTDPNYIMHKTDISPDKTYGVPRYSITVEHKGTGTSTSFILPVDDYNNLRSLYNDRQAAAASKAAAPAVAGPPVRPFPVAPPRAPSSTAGQGPPITPRMGTQPQPAPNAVENWWHGLNQPYQMPRGRGALPPPPQ